MKNKVINDYISFLKNRKNSNFGMSSLWKNYINDFNLKKNNIIRPSYGINYKTPNSLVILQLKIEQFVNFFILLINKIFKKVFSFLTPSITLFGYNNYKNFGLYITDNKFFELNKIDDEFNLYLNQIHQTLNWKYSYMSVKANYNVFKLKEYCKIENFNNKNILEIGSGLCQFSTILTTHLKKYSYVCVDLPNMIPHGYNTLINNKKDVDIFLPHQIEEFKNSNNNKKIIFILPDQFEELSIKYDLLINIESFGEMPQDTANNYLKNSIKKMNKKALIFLINRVARCINPNNPSNLKSWTFFSDYPLDNFKTIVRKIDDFKNLNSELEGNRANIFFLGEKKL